MCKNIDGFNVKLLNLKFKNRIYASIYIWYNKEVSSLRIKNIFCEFFLKQRVFVIDFLKELSDDISTIFYNSCTWIIILIKRWEKLDWIIQWRFVYLKQINKINKEKFSCRLICLLLKQRFFLNTFPLN